MRKLPFYMGYGLWHRTFFRGGALFALTIAHWGSASNSKDRMLLHLPAAALTSKNFTSGILKATPSVARRQYTSCKEKPSPSACILHTGITP